MSDSDLTSHQALPATPSGLTHLDARGHASMVDVGSKAETQRTARARVTVVMAAATLGRIVEADLPKGDVLAVARIAGIQAAKKTSDLIPLCHPLALTKVAVDFTPDAAAGASHESHLVIDTLCRLTGRTGVEMEALTAASVAALTIYDMCKAIDRGMRVTDLHLVEKLGGKSGHWRSDDATAAAAQEPSNG